MNIVTRLNNLTAALGGDPAGASNLHQALDRLEETVAKKKSYAAPARKTYTAPVTPVVDKTEPTE